MLPHTLLALARRGAPARPSSLALATDLARARARRVRLRDLGVDRGGSSTAARTPPPDARELDLTPPRADRDELRALYAAAF